MFELNILAFVVKFVRAKSNKSSAFIVQFAEMIRMISNYFCCSGDFETRVRGD